MKKGLILLIVLVSFTFMVGFVSSENEDTIMKFSSSTNAHAGLWNSSYDYILNYTEVFGSVYSGDLNSVHDCSVDGNNPILWLASENNSHVSVSSGAPYTISVCYGNLNCHVENDASSSCGNSEDKLIARLSNTTNAHISNASDTNYPVKICCGGGASGEPASINDNLHWENMLSHKIDKANLSATVKLVVPGENFLGTSPEDFEFEISKDVDNWFDKKIEFQPIKIIVENDSRVSALWNINDFSLMNKKVYFKVKMNGVDNRFVSSRLNITNIISNQRTIIGITPPCGYWNYTDKELNVTVNITDPDSFVEGTLDFGDSGDTKNVSNLKPLYSFLHTYSNPGNFQMVVNVTDELNRTKIGFTNIMILKQGVGGKFLAACVNSPKDYANIPGDSAYFDASNTVAIDYTGTGDPNSQKITPRDSDADNDADKLRFYWKFDGVPFTTLPDGNDAPHSGNIQGSYQFTWTFVESGNHRADLSVDFL